MPAPSAPDPAPRLLHEFFVAAARRWPERTAIDVPPPTHGGGDRTRWSYRELERASRRLAASLAAHVGADVVVAILLPRRTPWLYAAQLAALRAGAAWTCLDPTLPDDHLRFVAADCAAPVLVTDAAGLARAAAAALPPVHAIDVGALGDGDDPAAPVAPPLDERSLAYVIYTSGTTGRPKGVAIEHRGIANLVASDLDHFQLAPDHRVAQGSSPAYDSSIEETWLALAAGAAVVVMDDDAARLGPDLVAWLRRERITVWCPPPTQLRAAACDDPRAALPDLHLVYAGGEALSADLAAPWARALWLENGYGPTECSVTVTRARVHGGAPVTIGKPIRGHRAVVVDDALQPRPDGEAGELCLAGPGLARGYLGRPELTAERFPTLPDTGRVYRTGDLVRVDPTTGELHYLGRIDSQVKVRGHRIELEAVEATLAACPGVRQAACRVQGEDGDAALVAFVVPADPASPLAEGELRAALGQRLPAAMVPSRIAVLAELPTTVGGKLDRRRLPELSAHPGSAVRGAEPAGPVQRAIADVFRTVLTGVATIGADDDFFDLGGDSLRAAMAVSLLRRDPATASLAVRDVYAARTVAGLAALAVASSRTDDEDAAPVAAPSGAWPWVTAGQLLWLALELAAGAAVLGVLAFALLPWLLLELGSVATLLLLPLFAGAATAAVTVVGAVVAVAAKRTLIGRYRARRAPAWSAYRLRHWIVDRAVRLLPWGLVQGTELQCALLRLLGARIGERVHLHDGVALGGWDLLTIGDDAVLAQDAAVRTVALEAGELVLREVAIGRAATLEVRSTVDGGAAVGDGAVLAPSSWLPPGGAIPPGERWDGVPAQPAGTAPTAPVPAATLGPWAHALALWNGRLLVRGVLAAPLLAVALAAVLAYGIEGGDIVTWLQQPWRDPAVLLAVLAAPVATLPVGLLLQALIARLLAPPAGQVVARRSGAQLRVELATALTRSAGNWLSGTLLWPPWLRLAGMRVGRGCEISTIIDTVPRHVSVGDGTFCADGIYLGGPRVRPGAVALANTALGRDTFLGNHAVVVAGHRLPDGLLLGVSTVSDPLAMEDGGGWFGHPPFALPRREVVTLDRRLTHEPGTLRHLHRLAWECLRMLLPAWPTLVAVAWYDAGAGMVAAAAHLGAAWLAVAATTAAAAVATCLLVLLLKWSLLGRVRPGSHGLWSSWCCRWDFHYVAWHRWARGVLAHLEGTLLLPWYLRAMGARVGRRAVLGGGFAQVVDPDMIDIGDGATVEAQFQAHSFEDRVLKIAPLRVGRGATVAHNAVLMYGCDVGDRAQVAPNAVVMKNEALLPGRRYRGFPVRPVADDA